MGIAKGHPSYNKITEATGLLEKYITISVTYVHFPKSRHLSVWLQNESGEMLYLESKPDGARVPNITWAVCHLQQEGTDENSKWLVNFLALTKLIAFKWRNFPPVCASTTRPNSDFLLFSFSAIVRTSHSPARSFGHQNTKSQGMEFLDRQTKRNQNSKLTELLS